MTLRRRQGTLGRKPGKPLTQAELEGRRKAAAQSTGPRTPEGKAKSSRNAWKHGMYSAAARFRLQHSSVGHFGKPCRTTCPHHPENDPDFPCEAVMRKHTVAGSDCLSKEVYLAAFNDIMDSLKSGKVDSMHATLAAQLAGSIEVLQHLREEIAANGVVRIKPFIDKDGKVITDKDGAPIGEAVANPALPGYIKLLGELGLSLPELMATPKAAKGTAPLGEEDPISQLAQALNRARIPGGATIDGEAEVITDIDPDDVDETDLDD